MCEKCEIIREMLLEAVAVSALRVAESGGPADFDVWLEANPTARADLQLAELPFEMVQAIWTQGYVAGSLLAELRDRATTPQPNMPAAEA